MRPTSTLTKAALLALGFALAIAGPASAQKLESPNAGDTVIIEKGRPDITAPGYHQDRIDYQPMFKVEAVSFTAVDESGYDWLGSDEVFAVWWSEQLAAGSILFGNVDSGDTRAFHRLQSCIYPMGTERTLTASNGDAWQCREGGGSAPIDFSIDLYESDISFPHCFEGGSGGSPRTLCSSDWLGGYDVFMTEAELVDLLPRPDSFMVENVTVCACDLTLPPGSNLEGGGPTTEYEFSYIITRLDDLEVIVPPALGWR